MNYYTTGGFNVLLEKLDALNAKRIRNYHSVLIPEVLNNQYKLERKQIIKDYFSDMDDETLSNLLINEETGQIDLYQPQL